MHKFPDLERFVDAQAPVYSAALAELHAGSKRTNWTWFVFPQIAGLGHSSMAQRYAIASAAEALAYLRHPVLGLNPFSSSSPDRNGDATPNAANMPL